MTARVLTKQMYTNLINIQIASDYYVENFAVLHFQFTKHNNSHSELK